MLDNLYDVKPRPGWKLGSFVVANLYDQRAVLGSEIARHPLAVLWLAANVSKDQQPRAVHEWAARTTWAAAPPTRGLIQFVRELRDTIYNEIPRGDRIAELATLDEIGRQNAKPTDLGGAPVVAKARAALVAWATDDDVLVTVVLHTLGAPAPRAVGKWCRRGKPEAHIPIDDWLALVADEPRWGKVSGRAWPPLDRWRHAVGLGQGSLAQLATMARADWEEAWTRAGWRAGRALARRGRAWRAAGGHRSTRDEAEQLARAVAF